MTMPTFQEVRKRHGIILNMLIEDAQVDPSAVLREGTWNIGEAGIIDTLLASLSRLSGTEYHRDRFTIGGFTFSVDSPYALVAAAVAEVNQGPCEGGRLEQGEGHW